MNGTRNEPWTRKLRPALKLRMLSCQVLQSGQSRCFFYSFRTLRWQRKALIESFLLVYFLQIIYYCPFQPINNKPAIRVHDLTSQNRSKWRLTCKFERRNLEAKFRKISQLLHCFNKVPSLFEQNAGRKFLNCNIWTVFLALKLHRM